jgi:hypothetical protein
MSPRSGGAARRCRPSVRVPTRSAIRALWNCCGQESTALSLPCGSDTNKSRPLAGSTSMPTCRSRSELWLARGPGTPSLDGIDRQIACSLSLTASEPASPLRESDLCSGHALHQPADQGLRPARPRNPARYIGPLPCAGRCQSGWPRRCDEGRGTGDSPTWTSRSPARQPYRRRIRASHLVLDAIRRAAGLRGRRYGGVQLPVGAPSRSTE